MTSIPLEPPADHRYAGIMSGDQVSEYAAEIRTLMTERLRIKGASLEAQIKKSGRRLPRRIKRDAMKVAQAAKIVENPKLARMVDAASVKRQADNVTQHLRDIDPNAVFWDRVLWTLGKISAVVILIFVVSVWYAHRNGMI